MHSNSHLGVSLMAMAHAAAAVPHLTYACDTHYPWQRARRRDVEGGRIRFDGGCVRSSIARPGVTSITMAARGRERTARPTAARRPGRDAQASSTHLDRRLPRW
jgi:glucarate dehydratase